MGTVIKRDPPDHPISTLRWEEIFYALYQWTHESYGITDHDRIRHLDGLLNDICSYCLAFRSASPDGSLSEADHTIIEKQEYACLAALDELEGIQRQHGTEGKEELSSCWQGNVKDWKVQRCYPFNDKSLKNMTIAEYVWATAYALLQVYENISTIGLTEYRQYKDIIVSVVEEMRSDLLLSGIEIYGPYYRADSIISSDGTLLARRDTESFMRHLMEPGRDILVALETSGSPILEMILPAAFNEVVSEPGSMPTVYVVVPQNASVRTVCQRGKTLAEELGFAYFAHFGKTEMPADINIPVKHKLFAPGTGETSAGLDYGKYIGPLSSDTLYRFILRELLRTIKFTTHRWMRTLQRNGAPLDVYAEVKDRYYDVFQLFDESLSSNGKYTEFVFNAECSRFDFAMTKCYGLWTLTQRQENVGVWISFIEDIRLYDESRRDEINELIRKVGRIRDIIKIAEHSLEEMSVSSEELAKIALEVSADPDDPSRTDISVGLDKVLSATSGFDHYMQAWRSGVPIEDILA